MSGINFIFEKRHLYLIAAILVFLVGIGVVIALGSTPNPGHSISELQICDEGQTLKVVSGAWQCVPLPNIPRIIYGKINADGSKAYGSSEFTSSKVSAARYNITFTQLFSSPPSIVVTTKYPAPNSNPIVIIQSVNANSAEYYIGNSVSGGATETEHFFIVVGPN